MSYKRGLSGRGYILENIDFQKIRWDWVILSISLILVLLYFTVPFFNGISLTTTGKVVLNEERTESVAHMSFVIEIINAKHLDENRNFISEIGDEAKSLDGVWTETIPDKDFVRVTFEEKLTKENDITVYPRIISGTPRIEVYEVDGTELIAEFTTLNDNEYNKVFLTNLQGTQDTFDLKILNGSLEFDHIIDPWFDSNWGYRVNVTVQASQISSTLTNFPVYVNLSNLGASFFSNSNTDCTDLRVVEADETTETAREVVFCDTGTDTGELHFLADSLSSSVDTVFWIYYGNSGASEPAASSTFGSQNVWNNGYLAVYHLQETVNNDIDGYGDSTSNANHGQGVSMSATAPTGRLGLGQDFLPSADHIDLGASSRWSSMGSNDEFTISAWVNPNVDTTAGTDLDSCIVCQAGGSGLLWWLDDDGAGMGYLSYYYSGPNYVGDVDAQNVIANTWQYGTITYSSSLGDIYLDGSALVSAATAVWAQNTANFGIGAETGTSVTRPMDGQIDEVRISNVLRSADWISSEYTNQDASTTFYSIGAEEAAPAAGDSTDPTVTLNTPIDFFNSSTSITFNGTASDDVNLDNVTLYGNWTGSWIANETNSSPVNNTPTIFSKTIPDGEGYIWNYYACDNSSNCAFASANRTFTVDSTNPTVVSLDYPPNNSVVNSGLIDFNFTATDNIGLANCTLYTDFSGWAANETINNPANNTEINITIDPPEGTFIWNVFCEDNLGNSDWFTNNYTINVDSTAPTPTITQPSNNTFTNDNTPDIRITLTDNLANPIDYTFYINNSVNKTGTVANNTPTNITMDTLADGLWLVIVEATDNASNKANSSILYLNVDTTPPYFTTLVNQTQYVNEILSYDIDATDDGVGFDSFSIDDTTNFTINPSTGVITNITTLVEYYYVVNVSINDTLGNLNWSLWSLNVSAIPDTTNPTSSFGTNPVDNSNESSSVTFDFKASDNIDIDYIILYGNWSGGWHANYTDTSYTNDTWLNITVNGISDGKYVWGIFSNDSAGNSDWTDTNRTFTVDTTAPTITLNSPADDANLSQTEISFNFTVTDGTGLKNATIYANFSGAWGANETNQTTLTSGQSAIINVTGVPEGNFIWSVYACDSAAVENCGFATTNYSLNVDTTQPTFSGYARNPSTPNEDQNVQVNVTIIETNLDTVILEWGGTTNYTVTTSNGNEYYFTMLSGNYTAHDSVTYYWYANDTSTNINKSEQQAFTVANQIPSVSAPAINDTTPLTNDVISCNGGTFSDSDAEDSEQVRYFIWYDDDIEISGEVAQTLDLSVAGLDKTDVIKCSARVYDGYDNSSWTNSSNIATIQNSPPVITNPLTTISWDANGSTFNYDYGYTDADGDGETWYDNTTLFDINSGTGIISDTPTEDEAGSYSILINVSDGTDQDTDTFTYTINDVTNPSITLAYPQNTSYTINVSQLNFTYTETNPDKCWYSKNGGATNLSVQSCTSNFTDVVSVEGSNTWTVYINDTSGNENSGSVTFNKDTAYPAVTINSPLNQTYDTVSTTFNVTATDGGGISSCWYSLNAGSTNNSLTNSAGDYWDDTNSSMTQGPHTVNYYCNDTSNNLNGTEQETFFIDSVYPSITSLTKSPSDPATYVQGASYKFNATISDTNLDTILIEFNSVNYTPSNIVGDIYNFSITDLAAGSYNYYWYANDSVDNINQTSTQTYTINQNAEACNVLFNETSPVTYGTVFNAYSDCTSAFTLYRNGTSIANNSVQNLASSTYNFTVIRTDQSNYSNIYDDETFIINNASGDVTLLLNDSASNQPGIYGVQTNASASTSYGSITLYRNGTVVTGENNAFVTLAVGYYNYTATSNGDQNHSSSSITRFVDISKAQSEVNLTLNVTDGNITIIQDSSIYLNVTTITGDSGATLRLYNNATLINQGTSPLSNLTTFNVIGVFNITGIYDENQNFTASSESWWVNVTEAPDTQNPSVASLTESPSDPATYVQGETYEFNATITDNRDLSVVLIEFNSVNYTPTNFAGDVYNFTISNLAVGTYNYRWYVNDTSGNMNNTENDSYIINQATPALNLAIIPSNSETYGTETNATGSNCPSQLTCTLYREATPVSNSDVQTLGVGIYNYTYNTTGNTNYTSASVSENLTINEDTGSCSVLFNDASPITYPETFNVWSNCTSTFTLYRNGTTISNNSIQNLAARSYNFTVIRTDGANYSNTYDEETFVITKATGVVFTYLDNSRANKTMEQFTEIYLNSTLETGTGNIKLYNGTNLINQGVSPLSNLTNFTSISLYNITTIYEGNENYTTDSETWWVNVTESDVTPPQILTTYPANISYNSVQTQLNYTASDNFGLNICWYSLDNGDTNTTITCGNNVTGLNSGQGSSTWRVYANDSKGLENSSSVTFFVDSINPTIQFVSTTETGGSSVGRNYIQANVTASDTNLDTITIRLFNSTGSEIRTNTSTTSPFSINYTGLSVDTYFFNATANDTIGNSNNTETRNVSLVVPTLTIVLPENETYISNKNLSLNYIVSLENSVKYNLDGGSNTTITGNTTFNTSNGGHTLYLYANNSNGETVKNITFTVDLSKFRVIYNEYTGSTKGSATNFNQSSYENLQSLSNVVLENTDYGKIKFNEVINVTDDANISDNEADLDTYTNISENRIELNSAAIPNFNKSATLYLYNLTLDSPVRILRDGSVCPPTICTQQSYTGGTLIFNVTQFTVYSAEEIPAEGLTPPSRGGGGKVYECSENSECSENEACLDNRCIKLFDIKIIDFESPVKVGEFFDFTYFLKGMANINDDVRIQFWIEKEGKKITSGSDVIYFGSFEEKTEKTKIFLPKEVESGIYEFFVSVSYGSYSTYSQRTIEIEVRDEILAGITSPEELNIPLPILIAIILILIFLATKRIKARRRERKRDGLKSIIKQINMKADVSKELSGILSLGMEREINEKSPHIKIPKKPEMKPPIQKIEIKIPPTRPISEIEPFKEKPEKQTDIIQDIVNKETKEKPLEQYQKLPMKKVEKGKYLVIKPPRKPAVPVKEKTEKIKAKEEKSEEELFTIIDNLNQKEMIMKPVEKSQTKILPKEKPVIKPVQKYIERPRRIPLLERLEREIKQESTQEPQQIQTIEKPTEIKKIVKPKNKKVVKDENLEDKIKEK